MKRVPAEARAVFLNFDLLHAAGDFDLRAVVQVPGLRALEPDHFSVLFCHDNTFGPPQKSECRVQNETILHSAFIVLTYSLTPGSSSRHPIPPSCRLRGRRSGASL